jgi:hypothetical protein
VHPGLNHLSKRVQAAHQAALEALKDAEKLVEKEQKRLDEITEERRFDEDAADLQSRLVAGLHEALSLLEEGEGGLAEGLDRLRELERE